MNTKETLEVKKLEYELKHLAFIPTWGLVLKFYMAMLATGALGVAIGKYLLQGA